MKKSLIISILATVPFISPQSCPQPVNISILNQTFELGYGATNSQPLSVSPVQLQAVPGQSFQFIEGTYTLNFTVKNHFAAYPGYWTAQIDFGTQELCSMDGWGTAAVKQITMACPGPGYIVADQALPGGGPVQGAQPLTVNFSVPTGDWPIFFDKVALTFTPDNP